MQSKWFEVFFMETVLLNFLFFDLFRNKEQLVSYVEF